MANNIDIADAAAITQTMKTTDNAGVHTPHHNVDSSALPAGAATEAKQPALGTAGTASADVITVQGVASMTPVATTVGAGEAHIGQVGGTSIVVTASYTRPADTTTYAAGEVLCNSEDADPAPLAL